ncbi:GTP-binding protein [Shewanella olleyana]|uniref:CobW family GTP-binding protein n=1 Tax=Shewanella olleyana TaxID=135626 RepID=UPI002010A00E|nr:GTP-binding protein [Shewanella olleyana]MCL1067407.1 GTP-binding protein [Shewanella olleyana]
MKQSNDKPSALNHLDNDIQTKTEESRRALSGMLFATLAMRGRQTTVADKSLPLTILSGFLGSGKTTTLNNLLTTDHGIKLAVLVNDFGRINIDSALIESKTDDMISLTNGCACCAVSGDLTKTLIELTERKEVPEAIIIEASGIADPNGIAQVALSNPAIYLDGIITVLDAENLVSQTSSDHTSGTVIRQIQAADILLLNKLDIVNSQVRTQILEYLEQHFAQKVIIESLFGEVPISALLGQSKSPKVKYFPIEGSHHADKFESVSFNVKQPLDRNKLNLLFDALPPKIIRAKGVLLLSDNVNNRVAYQRVGGRWSYSDMGAWINDDAESNIVFIAPKGSVELLELESKLMACCV